jgi:AbiV family abortive infection protein
MDEKSLHVRQQCLSQAQGFIDAAERLGGGSEWPHIVYHLSLLALEEVGKASMISARSIDAARDDSRDPGRRCRPKQCKWIASLNNQMGEMAVKHLKRRFPAIVLITAFASAGAMSAQAHGTWVRGPGTYSVTVCAESVVTQVGHVYANARVGDGGPNGGGQLAENAAGAKRSAPVITPPPPPPPVACDITGVPHAPVALTFETWGGGGGGSAGAPGRHKTTPFTAPGGSGGGGGGGGGYGKQTLSTTIPVSGITTYSVTVGSAGAAGVPSTLYAPTNGQSGGLSQVRFNSTSGPLIVQGTGGAGGHWGNLLAYGAGGAPGGGNPNGWSGTNGYNGGVAGAHDCNGAGGGLGGAGAGPGRTGPGYVNDGGNGGHGGYTNTLLCTAHGVNYLLSPGAAGGYGQVKISW